MKKFNLKTLIIFTMISFILLSVTVNAKEHFHVEITYELFDAMDLSTTFEQTIIKMVDLQVQQNPQIAPYRKVMLDFFAKYMGWESLKADMAKIYIDKFSIEEIIKLKEFYNTPLGKKMSKLLPELTAEGAALGQRRVQDNMDELKRMVVEEEKKIQTK